MNLGKIDPNNMFKGVFQKKQRETFHNHHEVEFKYVIFFLYIFPEKFVSNDNTYNCWCIIGILYVFVVPIFLGNGD